MHLIHTIIVIYNSILDFVSMYLALVIQNSLANSVWLHTKVATLAVSGD